MFLLKLIINLCVVSSVSCCTYKPSIPTFPDHQLKIVICTIQSAQTVAQTPTMHQQQYDSVTWNRTHDLALAHLCTDALTTRLTNSRLTETHDVTYILTDSNYNYYSTLGPQNSSVRPCAHQNFLSKHLVNSSTF